MYPLKFEPILKQTLWGGDKIIPFKHLNSDLKGVGESWEISGVVEKNRKQIIICAAIVACVCVISVLITYNIFQQW